MVRCPTEIELLRYLEGALPAEEARVIEQHGSRCADCRRRLDGGGDDSFLDDVRRVARQPDLPPTNADWFDGATGEALGRYDIRGRIGVGGMGVVYEAEQQNPRRRVAIKVVNSVLMTPGLERRFAREVDALARLEHPGIARVLEAGTFEAHGEKRPFFAMELVEGRPLDDHVAEERLGRRERLALFMKVCEAVAHAHQKGVLHRDLKPSNILVTGGGQPKILDFGLARSVEGEEQSLHTREGQLVGTLPFMSPEQVGGDPRAIDTRSDVYALGLILYRLLTGRMPYEVEGKHAADIVRIVSTVEPRRLRAVDARVPRDLDTIAAKALEKDRERRYPSVEALAADVRRHLDDEPITARPPSTLYQLGKFTRRNKGVVVGLALAFLILVAGVVVSTGQARRARAAERASRAAEEEARLEARTAERVNEFMAHLLGAENALTRERPVDYTVREALDDAERWIETDLADEPRVEATVRVILGDLEGERGRHEEALRHLHRALALRESELGAEHVQTAGAANALGVAYHRSGDPDEAERYFRRSLAAYASHAGDPEVDKLIATTHLNLGILSHFAGDLDTAEVEMRQAIELYRQSLGQDALPVARGLQALARLEQDRGNPDEVVALLTEACAVQRASEKPNTMDAARTLSTLAGELRDRRRYPEAAESFRQALEIYSFLRGPEAPEVGVTRMRLGLVLRWNRDLEGAREEAESSVEILREHETHREDLATALTYLGYALRDQGELEGALDAFAEAADLRTELLGPDDELTRECEARILECEERLAQAAALGR